MLRHCLTLDLKDDRTAISEYKRYHVKIWPEVKESPFDAGVIEMEIMDLDDTFSLSAKAAADTVNQKVQEWRRLCTGFSSNCLVPGPNTGG
jgi:L-rhamnose mutarotase